MKYAKEYNIFKPIIGNKTLRINLLGQIKDLNDNIITLNRDKKNNVEIEIYDSIRKINFNRLILLSYFECGEMYKIEENIDNIIFYKPKEVKTIRFVSGWLMKFKEPVWYIKNGFRIIPNYVRYAMNKDGVIIDTKNNVIIPSTMFNNGWMQYPMVCVRSADWCKSAALPLHRLIGFTWIENPDYVNKVFINHIDGNKLNHKLENLEWVTASENNIHAVATGLTTANIPIKVLDVKSDVVKTFPSLTIFTTLVNGKYDKNASSYLKDTNGNLYKGQYELKLVDDKSEFFYRLPENRYYNIGKTHIIFKVKNNITNVVLNFNRHKTMLKALQLYLPDKYKSSSADKIVNYLNSTYKDFDFSYKIVALKGPYIILDLQTNIRYEVTSLVDMQMNICVDRNLIRKDLLNGIKRKYNNRWIVYQKGENPDITKYEAYYNKHKYIVINKQQGFKKEYSSIRSAAKELHMDKSVLLRSLHNKRQTRDGYIIKDASTEMWE